MATTQFDIASETIFPIFAVASRIGRRLEKDGWFLSRRGGAHDIYRHPKIEGIVTLPRYRQVTPAVARSIARKAGWVLPATDRGNMR